MPHHQHHNATRAATGVPNPPAVNPPCSIATRTRLHTLSADTSHSYVTHLLEFGYPPLMVQQQVGHVWGSTTALYTSVSDEFRNRLLEQALHDHPELWAEDP
jgi:hypothetical protein